ncbi:MAG TPA: DUF805 domain-containing protein [Chlamydiales bacterium]|nr:DUF805 domain-containing protein [Chlamydiales bacterium]
MDEKFWELFAFSGRVPRLRYFLYSSVFPLIAAIAYGLVVFGLTTVTDTVQSKILSIAVVVLLLAITIPFFGLLFVMPLSFQVRRWHDLNCSGWWVLAPVVLSIASFVSGTFVKPDAGLQLATIIQCALSLVIIAIQLVLLFKRGTIGNNNHGSDPLLTKQV